MSATVRTGTYDGTGPQPLFATCVTHAGPQLVGDRGALRTLVDWAASTGLSVDGLTALDTDDVRLDPATASRVADQLRRAGQVLRALEVPAVGWCGPDAAGLGGGVLGADVATEQGALLAAGDGPSMWATAAGGRARLVLRDGPGAPLATFTGWRHTGSRVSTADGVPIPAAVGARLVAMTGGSGDVVVAPATSVVAGLLTTLHELAVECASSGGVLRVGAGRSFS